MNIQYLIKACKNFEKKILISIVPSFKGIKESDSLFNELVSFTLTSKLIPSFTISTKMSPIVRLLISSSVSLNLPTLKK